MVQLKGIEKPLFFNILIFILYLFLLTLMLFNYSGSVELGFASYLFLSLLIHLIAAIIIDLRNKTYWNTIIVVSLILISIFRIDYYLNFIIN